METTVLIPARIRTDIDLLWLKEAIKSALGQGQVLVGLNNCTIELPEKIGAPHVMLEGKNLASIRNQMVRLVGTRFFFFLDHDDLIPEQVIEELENRYNVIAHDHEYLYGGTIMFGEGSRLSIPPQAFECEKLTRGVFFPNGVLQPTDNFAKVGDWDEELSILEDKEWWIRASEKGICGIPVPVQSYKYRQHSGSMVSMGKNGPAWKEAVAYIKKKHNKFYNGEYAMGSCCGKGKRKDDTRLPKVNSRKGGGRPRLPDITLKSEGSILLRYQLSTASSFFYGPYTGHTYQVSRKNPVIEVDVRDAQTYNSSRPGLLEMVRNNIRVFKKE